jgi:CHAD domain-containing protein/CYTH domain-containing protein
VALHLLASWDATRDRLDDTTDPEALHDFRVALRRLRSVLRAFRPDSDVLVTSGLRRRLKRLAEATGESRDLGVLRGWLKARMVELPLDQRAGAEWMDARLQGREVIALNHLRRKLTKHYGPLEKRLRARLTAVEDDEIAPVGQPVPTSALVAGAIAEWTGDLEYRLGAIKAITDDAPAHAARILVKRLKYLLAAMGDEIPAGASMLESLARLQDLLGDLHDCHRIAAELHEAHRVASRYLGEQEMQQLLPWSDGGFRVEIPPPPDALQGLAALATQLRTEGEVIYHQLRQEWLDGAGAADLCIGLHTLVRTLEGPTAPPLEIERKFLLSALPPHALLRPGEEIEQGYLPGLRLVERLRWVRSAEGDRWYRTVKSGEGISRIELEEETTPELFQALWPLTEGRRVRKRRYLVPEGMITWEIDEFLDRELAVAEVELPHASATVVIPGWLAPYIVRDVSEEPTYTNRALAR